MRISNVFYSFAMAICASTASFIRLVKPLKLLFAVAMILSSLYQPSQAHGKDFPMRNYEYRQNFESKDPFQYWASDGTYTVNYKGLSIDKSASGRSSFKLDVTLGTATHLYFRIPIKVPTVGDLRFSGDLYIESTSGVRAALGANISLFPSNISGTYVLKQNNKPSDTWIKQSADLVQAGAETATSLINRHLAMATLGDVGIWTDSIAIYIYAESGGQITLYVDNILLEGRVPVEADYLSSTSLAWKNYLKRSQNTVEKKLFGILSLLQSSAVPQSDVIIAKPKSVASKIRADVRKRGYTYPDELAEIEKLESFLPQTLSYVEAHTNDSLIPYPWQPITAKKVLPFSYPILSAFPGTSLTLMACRGEFEPVSFVIRSRKPTAQINILATDLSSAEGVVIPATAIDVRLVKAWYQAGEGTIGNTQKRFLLPELMLKDDKLVSVDYVTEKNLLRVILNGKKQYIDISSPNGAVPKQALVADADVLQPFDLDADSNKQVWITVRIPDNAHSAEYFGKIIVQASGESPLEISLSVTVLPFDLEPSLLEYAIYYRGVLVPTAKNTIGSEWKTPELYELELNNMKDHGILYPTLYQGRDSMLSTALRIREKVGLPKDRLYAIGIDKRNPKDIDGFSDLSIEIKQWRDAISKYGYSSLYAYGIDEAYGEGLRSQRPEWQAIKRAGGQIFAACSEGAVDIVGDLLDTAILLGDDKPTEITKWHSHKKKVLSYGNPQVGIENSEIYRKNFGFGLACAGYDGAMDYAYQHSFGDIWNDFDHPTYRDHVFAYPTTNGVVDTIQWEGFREGVDDVRYLSTLIKLSKSDNTTVLPWLCSTLKSEASLSDVRSKIIDRILNIKSQSSSKP